MKSGTDENKANMNEPSVKKTASFSTSGSKVNEIKDDTIGGSSAGGVAGSGGVSTNSVGQSKTSKQPLTER